jgi:N,N'-diacetyllegionaminate synthase
MKKGYHILEIANVHGGDFDYFKKIIKDISVYNSPEFGVKLQVLKPDLIALPDFSYYDLYHELCFDLKQWDEIISLAAETKDVWIDVFDLYGVEIIEKFTNKIYGVKFQASVLDNIEVFEALSKIDISDKYLMVNISGIPENQIQDKLDIIEKYIKCKEVIIQMGYQSYPTSVDKSGLGKIEVLNNKFDNKIIYADHTDGKNNDAKIVPVLAMYAGAFGIEKHIMLNEDVETKYDFQASLTLNQLDDYLSDFKRYNAILIQDFISDNEAEYLRKTIQKPVTNTPLLKGNIAKLNDFYFRRTDNDGLSLEEIQHYLNNGYVLRNDIEKNKPVNHKDFKKITVASIIACRLKSTRLKSKATLNIGALSSIELCVKNVLKIKEANHVVLATSNLESDAELVNYCYDDSVIFHTGDAEDVIERYLGICDTKSIDVIVRITGDCPYISSEIATILYDSHIKNGADFTYANDFSVGTSVEIINTSALKKIKQHFKSANNSEYMSWYFMNNPEHFNLNGVDLPKKYIRDYRLTLDYQEDIDLFREIQKYLDESKKEFTLDAIFEFLDVNPEVVNINKSLTLTYKTDQELIDRLNIETKIK